MKPEDRLPLALFFLRLDVFIVFFALYVLRDSDTLWTISKRS